MRLLALMVIVLFAFMPLAGCGGGSKSSSTENTGSLLRSYKLIDDQGRESGTLVINPMGGAELRNIDGTVIGSFAPGGSATGAMKTETADEKENTAETEEKKKE